MLLIGNVLFMLNVVIVCLVLMDVLCQCVCLLLCLWQNSIVLLCLCFGSSVSIVLGFGKLYRQWKFEFCWYGQVVFVLCMCLGVVVISIMVFLLVRCISWWWWWVNLVGVIKGDVCQCRVLLLVVGLCVYLVCSSIVLICMNLCILISEFLFLFLLLKLSCDEVMVFRLCSIFCVFLDRCVWDFELVSLKLLRKL